METQLLLANAFMRDHPEDSARLLERVQPGDAAEILSQASLEHAAPVVARMIPVHATAVLRSIDANLAAQLLKKLPIDHAASLIRRLPEERQQTIIQHLDGEVGEAISRVLNYPPDSAGALMDPFALAVPHDIDVGEAQKRVQELPEHVRYYVYVVDRERKLLGVVTLRELMQANSSDEISSLMNGQVATIRATAAREEIIANPHWKEYHALPVVDGKGVFLGVLSYETLRNLEFESSQNRIEHGAMDAATAMGELFWIGLSGMLGGVFSGVASQSERPPEGDQRE